MQRRLFEVGAVATVAALLTGCGVRIPEDDPYQRRVILFNRKVDKVLLARDRDGLEIALRAVATPYHGPTMANFEAAKLEGKLFEVPNGTRAVVLKQVETGVSGVDLVLVKLRTGPHAGEVGLCFSKTIEDDPDFR